MDDYETLEYASGNHDGDGHVVVGSHECLTVGLDKALKSKSVLILFKKTFKGNIYSKTEETETTQSQFTWKVHANDALTAINLLKAHSHIKRKQLEIASTFPMQLKVEVLAEKAGHQSVTYKSMQDCADKMGVHYSVVVRRLTPPKEGVVRRKPQDINGWTLTKIVRDSAAVSAERAAISAELQRLKHVSHDVITETLSFPYCSGFFDSEGTISITGPNSWKLAIGQAFPEILYALKRQFGGSVFVSKKTANRCNWQLYPKGATPFLQGCLPYLIEKKKQAELVLTMEKDGGAALKKILRSLKGNYTVGMKISKSAVPEGVTLGR